MMNKKPEILAPAGSVESLYAAVRCGADAVYLGTKDFNARRNADNFDYDSLKECVRYCHIRGVKVYVTMNTLITDRELAAASEAVKMICRCGVDALIVQDLAVASLAKRICPQIALHASTQMSVTNINGVKALEELGFSRVVLARELSFDEIKEITSNTDTEIEVFVHGALCSCVSGMCYLSSVIGGRSGNRGLCAQPCRLDFRFKNTDHALSLKDMSYIENVRALAEAGVCSLKIEGRMKRPEYVAAAVTECRKSLDGTAPDMKTLKNVFSRGGFTDGYYKAKRDIAMRGIRTKEDVTSFEIVKDQLHALYRKDVPSVTVNGKLVIKRGQPSIFVLSDGKREVTVLGDVPDDAENRALTRDFAYEKLSKLGSTPYILSDLDFESDDGLFLPIPILNRLKNDAAEKLSAIREKNIYDSINDIEDPLNGYDSHMTDEKKFILRFERAEQFFGVIDYVKYYVFPVEELINHPDIILECGDKTVGEMPAVTFQSDLKKLEDTLAVLKENGLHLLAVNGICDIFTAKKIGFEMIGSFGLNITNSVSLKEYDSLGVGTPCISFELNAGAVRDLKGGSERSLLVYGHLPLMRFRRCPAKIKGCSGCTGENVLTDEKNNTFRLLCHQRRYSTLYNNVPLYAADKDIKGVDAGLLYFTFEKRDEAAEIFNAVKKNAMFDKPKTGGLYFRKLL